MSWKNHLSEEDRRNLRQKALHDLAKLARIGFFAGLLHAVNEHRKQNRLPPLRRPPNLRTPDWERKLNAHIEGVIETLYTKAGEPGIDHLMWLEHQFDSLKARVKGAFTAHDES